MSRIQSCFEQLAQEGKKALIPYITAGDPDPDTTLELLNTLVESGADIIELGVPFSDPMADGPVIQAACERALVHNTSLKKVLEIVKEFRASNSNTPIVLMGYQNPIEVMGMNKFVKAAVDAQIDGVLTVDMPIEQAGDSLDVYKENNIDPIFLIAPTTNQNRIKNICDKSSGFVYYVSLKGVTGAANLQLDEVQEKVAQIKQVSSLPVGVGFGIKDADSARNIAALADAVVVGSAIIRLIEKHSSDKMQMLKEVKSLVSSMRNAINEETVNAQVA